MSESEDSVIPSTMNLQDLMEMALAKPEAEQTSSSVTTLTGTKASISVAEQLTTNDKDLKINYNKSLMDRIGALANSETLSDVKFLVGEDKAEFHAHKVLLAVSSPVFTSMFYSPMLTSQSVIEIPDCQPEAFQILIQYLYKGEKGIKLKKSEVPLILAVLYAARKYAVKGLEDICAVTLSSGLNAENVFDVLNASNLHSLMVLETECWGHIEDNIDAVLESHLNNVDAELFTLILKNDRLNIKEVRLFEHLLKWMELECENQNLPPTLDNKLTVGKKVLDLIRFPTMTAGEFADKVVPTGILKVEQVAKILTYISTSLENKELYSPEYSTKKREPRSQDSQLPTKSHSQASLGGPTFITFELERNSTNSNAMSNNVIIVEPEERPRSRRRRSRRRNNRDNVV